MSFKRREKPSTGAPSATTARGIRPSVANGAPVTSTGCPSLDAVLSGHGGLPTGSLFLIEEQGTTDFASVLLRYFAAEGVLQGHTVWLGGGLPETWFRSLPQAVDRPASSEKSASSRPSPGTTAEQERMKIAWRYHSLGEFGNGLRERPPTHGAAEGAESAQTDVFCHAYDLTKRLVLPEGADCVASPPCAGASASSSVDPFAPLLASLMETLQKSTGFVRAVLPLLLSPGLYPPGASQPRYLVRFFNNLRLICRQYPHRIAIMASLPLDLYPRNTSMTTWAELLADGVLELTPLPSSANDATALDSASTLGNDRSGPQGLLKLIKVPQLERWTAGAEIDLAFKVTRKRFSIEAWSLPALGEETGREGGGALGGQGPTAQTKVDISF